ICRSACSADCPGQSCFSHSPTTRDSIAASSSGPYSPMARRSSARLSEYRLSLPSNRNDHSFVSPNSSMIAWAAELPVRPLRTITSAILSRSSSWSLTFDQLQITRKRCPDAVKLAVEPKRVIRPDLPVVPERGVDGDVRRANDHNLDQCSLTHG